MSVRVEKTDHNVYGGQGAVRVEGTQADGSEPSATDSSVPIATLDPAARLLRAGVASNVVVVGSGSGNASAAAGLVEMALSVTAKGVRMEQDGDVVIIYPKQDLNPPPELLEQWAAELRCELDEVLREINRRIPELRALQLGSGGGGDGVAVELAHIENVWRAAENVTVDCGGESVSFIKLFLPALKVVLEKLVDKDDALGWLHSLLCDPARILAFGASAIGVLLRLASGEQLAEACGFAEACAELRSANPELEALSNEEIFRALFHGGIFFGAEELTPELLLKFGILAACYYGGKIILLAIVGGELPDSLADSYAWHFRLDNQALRLKMPKMFDERGELASGEAYQIYEIGDYNAGNIRFRYSNLGEYLWVLAVARRGSECGRVQTSRNLRGFEESMRESLERGVELFEGLCDGSRGLGDGSRAHAHLTQSGERIAGRRRWDPELASLLNLPFKPPPREGPRDTLGCTGVRTHRVHVPLKELNTEMLRRWNAVNSTLDGKVQPRCSRERQPRDAAEMQPRDAAEVWPRCDRDATEMRPRCGPRCGPRCSLTPTA